MPNQVPLHNDMAKSYATDSRDINLEAIIQNRVGNERFNFLKEFYPDELAGMKADLGERIRSGQEKSDSLGTSTQYSSKTPIGPQAFYDIWQMLKTNSPAGQELKNSQKDIKNILGGVSKGIMANPWVMMDTRGVGKTIEWLDPRFKNLADERHAPYKNIEVLMDLNKDYQDSLKNLSQHEQNLLANLMGGRITQGIVGNQGMKSYGSVESYNPYMLNTPSGEETLSPGELRLQNAVRDVLKPDETAEFLDNFKTMASVVGKYTQKGLPGVGPFEGLVGKNWFGFTTVPKTKQEKDDAIALRTAGEALVKAYQLTLSGKSSTDKEFEQIKSILTLGTAATPEQYIDAMERFKKKYANQLRTRINTSVPTVKKAIENLGPNAILPEDIEKVFLTPAIPVDKRGRRIQQKFSPTPSGEPEKKITDIEVRVKANGQEGRSTGNVINDLELVKKKKAK